MSDNKKNIREERIRKVFIVLTTLYSQSRLSWTKLSIYQIITDAGLFAPWPGALSKAIQNGYIEKQSTKAGIWRWVDSEVIPDIKMAERIHDAAKLENDNKKTTKKVDAKVKGLVKVNEYDPNVPERIQIEAVLTKMSKSYKKSEIIDQSIFRKNKITDKEVFLTALTTLGIITQQNNSGVYYWSIDILEVDKTIISLVFDEYVKKYIHAKDETNTVNNVLNFLYKIADQRNGGYPGSLQPLLKEFKLRPVHKAMAMRLDIISDHSKNPGKELYFVNGEITTKIAQDIVNGVIEMDKATETITTYSKPQHVRDNVITILNGLNRMTKTDAIHRTAFIEHHQIDDVIFDALVSAGAITKFPFSKHYNASVVNVTNRLIKSVMDYDPTTIKQPEDTRIKNLSQLLLEIHVANGLKTGLRHKFVKRELDMAYMTKLMESEYLINKGTSTKPVYYINTTDQLLSTETIATNIIKMVDHDYFLSRLDSKTPKKVEPIVKTPIDIKPTTVGSGDEKAEPFLAALIEIKSKGLTTSLSKYLEAIGVRRENATTAANLGYIKNVGTRRNPDYKVYGDPTLKMTLEILTENRLRLRNQYLERNGTVPHAPKVNIPVQTAVVERQETIKKPEDIGNTKSFDTIYEHAVKDMEYNTQCMNQCVANVASMKEQIEVIMKQIEEQQATHATHEKAHGSAEEKVNQFKQLMA